MNTWDHSRRLIRGVRLGECDSRCDLAWCKWQLNKEPEGFYSFYFPFSLYDCRYRLTKTTIQFPAYIYHFANTISLFLQTISLLFPTMDRNKGGKLYYGKQQQKKEVEWVGNAAVRRRGVWMRGGSTVGGLQRKDHMKSGQQLCIHNCHVIRPDMEK